MRPIVARAVHEVLVVFTDAEHIGDVRARDDRLARARPGFVAWPSDGQLAMHLLAWLRGPGFRDAALDAALSPKGRLCAPDFDAASEAVLTLPNAGHPGAIAIAGKAAQAYRNAARVLRYELLEEVLYYPSVLP